MAEARKKNLREGLLELHQRKLKTTQATSIRSAQNQRARERRLHKPERPDERYTKPTVLNSVLQSGAGVRPDPNWAEKVEAAKARVAEKKALDEEERRNYLHTLYQNSKYFITNEAQLNAQIDAVFGPFPDNKNRAWSKPSTGIPGSNIWHVGEPLSIKQRLASKEIGPVDALSFNTGTQVLTQKRKKKIAEELTGGSF